MGSIQKSSATFLVCTRSCVWSLTRYRVEDTFWGWGFSPVAERMPSRHWVPCWFPSTKCFISFYFWVTVTLSRAYKNHTFKAAPCPLPTVRMWVWKSLFCLQTTNCLTLKAHPLCRRFPVILTAYWCRMWKQALKVYSLSGASQLAVPWQGTRGDSKYSVRSRDEWMYKWIMW